jgi:cyclic pyranopterin phosphate synthase
MVDVTPKPDVYREAKAQGSIKLKPETISLLRSGKVAKGNPFETAKIAGILAAKNTHSLIPLCHPLQLTNIIIKPEIIDQYTVMVESTVKTKAQTGVEMEALTATSMALLTIWDMTKQYEKDKKGQYPNTCIQNIHVVSKIKKELQEKSAI